MDEHYIIVKAGRTDEDEEEVKSEREREKKMAIAR